MQVEILEDRCLLTTQLMGSFDLGVGEGRLWDGPVVHGAIVIDSEGGDGLNHTGNGPLGQAVDTPLCGLDQDFPCWDYKLNLAEGGERLRVAVDAYLLNVRRWPDPILVPGTGDGTVDGATTIARLVALFPNGNSYGISLLDPQGNYAVVNADCFVLRCGYTNELFVDAPAPGEWTVRLIPFWVTDLGFRLRAKLEDVSAPPAEATPMYPDLRIIPPFEFTFMTPAYTYGPGVDVPGIETGCMAEELADPDTGEPPIGKACLRFSMGIENAGDGPLLISPPADDDGVVQWLKRSDGTVIECDAEHSDPACYGRTTAGFTEFHDTHRHVHYEDVWQFQLFQVTDVRAGSLSPIGQGHKSGFSPGDEMFSDWERFYQDVRFSSFNLRTSDGAGPGFAQSTGWGDVYEWNRSGNYVDIPVSLDDLNPAGGYYVLRGAADTDDHLLETREDNNVSYALIYVDGRDMITCERGYGESPWDPHKVIARAMPTNEPGADSPFCRSDLRIDNITATNNLAPQGDKVTITATIANRGTSAAPASRTEFVLDGITVLAVVDTPPIPIGSSAQISIQLRTAAMYGTHTIRVTADRTGLVAESNENNNVATLTLVIRGNQSSGGTLASSSDDSGSGSAECTSELVSILDPVVTFSCSLIAGDDPGLSSSAVVAESTLEPATVTQFLAIIEVEQWTLPPEDDELDSAALVDAAFEEPLSSDLLAW